MASSATIAEGERVNQRLLAQDDKNRQPVVVGDYDKNNRYPAQLFKPAGEADTKVLLTRQLKDAGYGDTIITDRLVDYFYDKAQEDEFAKREKWIAENFDSTNPVTKAWLEKVAPGFYDRREQYALQKLRDQEKLVRLAFHGPNSEEDLDFMYHIATGRVNIYDLETPPWKQEPRGPMAEDNYIAGLFSPRVWTDGAALNIREKNFFGGQIWGPNNRREPQPRTYVDRNDDEYGRPVVFRGVQRGPTHGIDEIIRRSRADGGRYPVLANPAVRVQDQLPILRTAERQ